MWLFIKNRFYYRLALYELVSFSFTLYVSFPIMYVRFWSFPVCLVSSILLIPILISLLVLNRQFLFSKKIDASQEVKEEVEKIAKKMRVKMPNVKVQKGLDNAYVRFNTLVLGEKLLSRLSDEARLGVIAHELKHLKEKHFFISLICALAFSAIPLFLWHKNSWLIIWNEQFTIITVNLIMNVASLSVVIIAMIPVNIVLEFRADKAMSEILGKSVTVLALLAVSDKESFKFPSETHPAMLERIKYILKSKPDHKQI